MKILVIGKVYPEPQSSAAGRNMLYLLRLLKELGEVTFATTASVTGRETNLLEEGIRLATISLNDPTTAGWLATLQPDLVVFDRFMTEEQFSWQVAEVCPDAIRVLNTEDLHFLRKARETAVKKNVPMDLFSDDTARELAAIYRSDLSLIMGSYEHQLLVNEMGVPEQLLLHYPLFSEGPVSDLPGFSQRTDCLFIGNFLHAPNLDAVRWLKKHIWPLIHRENKNLKLHIYGAYPTQEVVEMHAPAEHFFVHGELESVPATMRMVRLNLAPLRFGAGIKGKVLEAMECGTPTIGTSIAAESMTLGTDWCGTIGDEPESFARAVLQLYEDEENWKSAQEAGTRILTELFAPSTYQQALRNRLDDILSNKVKERSSSYTAWMVRQQSLWSSRYMAKWIMEKNK